jgi:O-antigen biosynthesis protein
VFEELGGFEERLRVAFNDVDLGIRALRKGYVNVYTPHALLYHEESSSRGTLHPEEDEAFFCERWGPPFSTADPYYNPNFSRKHPFRLDLPT